MRFRLTVLCNKSVKINGRNKCVIQDMQNMKINPHDLKIDKLILYTE